MPRPQVVRQELAAIPELPTPQKPNPKPPPCVQLRLVLRSGMFKIEHHPMEVCTRLCVQCVRYMYIYIYIYIYTAFLLCISCKQKVDQNLTSFSRLQKTDQAWLAVRAPLLRAAATQFHLLRHRVLHMFSFKAGQPHATDVADLHTPKRSKVRRQLPHAHTTRTAPICITTHQQRLQYPRVHHYPCQEDLTPEEAAMAREVTRGHEMACKRSACSQHCGTLEGALMHVAAEHAEVLLVVNPSEGMYGVDFSRC